LVFGQHALAEITADEIKVDRAFITSIHQRVRSQGILKAIESLCSALNIGMVAEGVETQEELAYLQKHTAIHLVQGYFFSKPVFLDALRPPKLEQDERYEVNSCDVALGVIAASKLGTIQQGSSRHHNLVAELVAEHGI
jgi:predicted signal transduction protein with EAL and GGDEF domain